MQYIVDARCSRGLGDPQVIRQFVQDVVQATGLNLRQFIIEEFPNGSDYGAGISALALISESHIAIHTIPQNGLLQFDVFSCKPFVPQVIDKLIVKHFGCLEVSGFRLRHLVLGR